jgi:hypothetical protein
MIEFQRNIGRFKIKEIWFGDDVYDVDGVDSVYFGNVKFSGQKPGFKRENIKTLVIDLSKSMEDIWQGMDKKLCQTNISKALEDSSYVIRFNEKYEEFSKINRQFRRRKALPPSLIPIDEMKKNYFLSTYEKDGVVLGGHLCIKDKGKFEIFMACSSMAPDSKFSRTIYGRANRLSIWEMMKYAKGEGIDTFDFGGYATGAIAENLKGVNRFKSSFGGTLCEKNSYSKSYSKLYDISYSIYWTNIFAWIRVRNLIYRKRMRRNGEKMQNNKDDSINSKWISVPNPLSRKHQ